MRNPMFTPEELAELAVFDAEIDNDPMAKKNAEYQHAYYLANKEKIAAYQRSYREANREKIAKNKRAYRKANRERFAEYQRAYREANREKRRAVKESSKNVECLEDMNG